MRREEKKSHASKEGLFWFERKRVREVSKSREVWAEEVGKRAVETRQYRRYSKMTAM